MVNLVAPEEIPVAVEVAVVLQMVALTGMASREKGFFASVYVPGPVIIGVAREEGSGSVLITTQVFHKVRKSRWIVFVDGRFCLGSYHDQGVA